MQFQLHKINILIYFIFFSLLCFGSQNTEKNIALYDLGKKACNVKIEYLSDEKIINNLHDVPRYFPYAENLQSILISENKTFRLRNIIIKMSTSNVYDGYFKYKQKYYDQRDRRYRSNEYAKDVSGVFWITKNADEAITVYNEILKCTTLTLSQALTLSYWSGKTFTFVWKNKKQVISNDLWPDKYIESEQLLSSGKTEYFAYCDYEDSNSSQLSLYKTICGNYVIELALFDGSKDRLNLLKKNFESDQAIIKDSRIISLDWGKDYIAKNNYYNQFNLFPIMEKYRNIDSFLEKKNNCLGLLNNEIRTIYKLDKYIPYKQEKDRIQKAKEDQERLFNTILGFTIFGFIIWIFILKRRDPNKKCAWCGSRKLNFIEGSVGRKFWEFRNIDGSPDKRVKNNKILAKYASSARCTQCNAITFFVHETSSTPSYRVKVYIRKLGTKGNGERISNDWENSNISHPDPDSANRKNN